MKLEKRLNITFLILMVGALKSGHLHAATGIDGDATSSGLTFSGPVTISTVTASSATFTTATITNLYATSTNIIPPGTIFSFAGSTVPAGYLWCDGSSVSRTTYAALFAAIGTAWGAGDGSTTFILPDFRGRFQRGVDGTAGRDPNKATRTANASGGNTGNAVGSIQIDMVTDHNHSLPGIVNQSGGGTQSYANRTFTGFGAWQTATIASFSGGAATETGLETRPINSYVNYMIKY